MFTEKQENRKIYKSSRYEYSSSSSNTRDGGIVSQPKSYESVEPPTTIHTTTATSTNINQLDNLLDDLKQERDYSYDKGKTVRDIETANFIAFLK